MGVFGTIVHDLHLLVRLVAGRTGQSSAALLDSGMLQSALESGARTGYDGHKRRKESKVHAVVDRVGHLLALIVIPADAQDHSHLAALAEAIQAATGERCEEVYVDQGDIGAQTSVYAAAPGIRMEIAQQLRASSRPGIAMGRLDVCHL